MASELAESNTTNATTRQPGTRRSPHSHAPSPPSSSPRPTRSTLLDSAHGDARGAVTGTAAGARRHSSAPEPSACRHVSPRRSPEAISPSSTHTATQRTGLGPVVLSRWCEHRWRTGVGHTGRRPRRARRDATLPLPPLTPSLFVLLLLLLLVMPVRQAKENAQEYVG